MTKLTSGCTGPPRKMRTLPEAVASLLPNTARRSVSGFSPSGRLMTIPSAPSLSCRTIRITAWSKRGSRIAGVAMRNWPLSDGGASVAWGDVAVRAADSTRTARIRRWAAMKGMRLSLEHVADANAHAGYQRAGNSARRCSHPCRNWAGTARIRRPSHNLDQQLSEVLALEQAEEGSRRVFQAVDYVFAISKPAAAHPGAGFALEIGLPGGEIRYDETAQGEALAQHREHVGAWNGRRGVVLGDQPAHGDASEIVEQRPHGLLDCAAHVLEINVDAGRACGVEPPRKVSSAMVHTGIEAKFLDHVAALVRPAGNPHCAASLDLGDLPDHRPDGAGRRRNRDGLARLGLANFQEPRPGRHARHAEDAERGCYRSRRGIELAQADAAGKRVILPAPIAQHDIADGEFGISRLHDLADRAAHHGLADLHLLGVRPRGAHTAAHIGVERQIADAHQHLPVARLRRRPLHQFEIVGSWRAGGPALEQDLAIDAGSHGGLLAVVSVERVEMVPFGAMLPVVERLYGNTWIPPASSSAAQAWTGGRKPPGFAAGLY